MQGFLDHIVLNIEDDEIIIDFYTNILMLQAERLEAYRAGNAPFPSVRINQNTVIDLFPRKLWEQNVSAGQGFRNLNHFCLSLTKKDWEDLQGRLRDHKIAISEGPVQRWGARGSGTSIYFTDPEGNAIEARFYERNDQPEKCLLGT
ncbi:VOC family protein [Nitrospira sp. T9]|uniref:VOC family protein n=1 Tax=unclassified Nitrospira TaxID=2652172 RepID=UPI003F9E2625